MLVSQQAIRNADIRSKKHKNAEIRFAGRIVNRACVCNYHDCKSEVLRESTRKTFGRCVAAVSRVLCVEARSYSGKNGRRNGGWTKGFPCKTHKNIKTFPPGQSLPGLHASSPRDTAKNSHFVCEIAAPSLRRDKKCIYIMS